MASVGKGIYNVGFWIRETGQALDRLGSRLQGYYALQEALSRHRTIMNLHDKVPVVAPKSFVAPNAAIIGDVKVGGGSSVWYGCILRGDVNSITVGSNTNIQDNTLIHVAQTNVSESEFPTVIGSRVTIGHSAVLHGCTVEDEALIGMCATVLDGAYIEKNAMVAAGALVKDGTRVPSEEVWGGNPARFLRKLTSEEIAFFVKSAEKYADLADLHAKENLQTYEEFLADKVLQKKWYVPSHPSDSRLGIIHEAPPVETTFESFSQENY